ncbi:MAG: TetR/AcrR family transcriptional regulator [Clostridium sp.]
MDNKKRAIIDVAIGCFNSKVVGETSIDEIVKGCRISKATFYKYFKNKEDLIGDMLISLKNQFLEEILEIEKSGNDSRDILVEKIVKTINFINVSIPFYTQVIEGFQTINGENANNVRVEIRNIIINEYYNSVVEVYGKSNNTWDMVFAVDSFVHQFNFIHKLNSINPDINKHGEYILNILDLLNKELDVNNSFVDKDIFFASGYETRELTLKQRVLEDINSLKLRGNNLGDNIIEAINIIEDEIKGDRYTSVILEGMLMYIESNPNISEEINKIREMISRM